MDASIHYKCYVSVKGKAIDPSTTDDFDKNATTKFEFSCALSKLAAKNAIPPSPGIIAIVYWKAYVGKDEHGMLLK